MWSIIFFFKQKTAYEMRISDWSSDVCSSDLLILFAAADKWAGARPRLRDRHGAHVRGLRPRLYIATDGRLNLRRQRRIDGEGDTRLPTALHGRNVARLRTQASAAGPVHLERKTDDEGKRVTVSVGPGGGRD